MNQPLITKGQQVESKEKDTEVCHMKSMEVFGDAGTLRNDPPTVTQNLCSYRRISDVVSKPVNWLWKNRIARGKISMLVGHPGLGKSQITAYMAAIVSTGGAWPVDYDVCPIGNVVLLSAEDDAADTIRPRLEAAGADIEKVYIIDAMKDGSNERMFNLTVDLPRVENLLQCIGDVALIIIDPITAYLGKTDSHKNADIRGLLSPLSDLAMKCGAAVVCVSHLNKGGNNNDPLTRVMGSMAFVATARTVFIIAKDMANPLRRLFLPIKNNIGNDVSGFAFTVESITLPNDIETSCVVWESEAVTLSAEDAMRSSPAEKSAVEGAIEFLTNLLADGPMSSAQVITEATADGHSCRTIGRAKKELGILAVKGGMQKGWMCQLPPKSAKIAEECQTNMMATFGDVGTLKGGDVPIDLSGCDSNGEWS